MRKVGATHRSKVISLLNERLAFERAALQIYGGVLEKLRSFGGPYQSVQARLRLIREEERAHEEWLQEQLRALGGGPDGESDGLLRVKAESRRIEGAMMVEHDPAALFRLLLGLEVSDVGGWELLLELADRAQDDEAREAFRQRLEEEQEHFRFVSHLAAVSTGSRILDETVITLEDASA